MQASKVSSADSEPCFPQDRREPCGSSLQVSEL